MDNLKKYFRLSCENSKVTKRDLLTDTEVLKHFAKLGGDYMADTMQMLSVIQYEYMAENSFSEREISGVQAALGKVAVFMRDCKKEYELMLLEQQQAADKKNIDN